MEARLLDERGESVHVPETRHGARVVSRVGEILIRGGTVFSGYSAQGGLLRGDFSSDAFFRTGDVGFWDSLGYSACAHKSVCLAPALTTARYVAAVTVCDRAKDLILVGGENGGFPSL